MKKLFTLSLSCLLVPTIHAHTQRIENNIELTSPVLKMFDGTTIGINADIIELIGLVRREVNIMILGQKSKNGSYTGSYEFEGKLYSVTNLVDLEQDKTTDISRTHALHDLLQKIKVEFIKKVDPFMASARKTKHQMMVLVEESAHKRHKENTLLLKWADATEGREEEVFMKEVTTFAALEDFAYDLLDFLGDLIRSCPNARQQFVERAKKCNKIHLLLPKALPKIDAEAQKAFMHYLKDKHVDKMELRDITIESIETFFHRFSRTGGDE